MTKGQTGIIVICVKFIKALAVVTECGKHSVEYAAANLKPRLQIWILIPAELLQIFLISRERAALTVS